MSNLLPLRKVNRLLIISSRNTLNLPVEYKRTKSKKACYVCGKVGNFAKQCKFQKSKRNRESSNNVTLFQQANMNIGTSSRSELLNLRYLWPVNLQICMLIYEQTFMFVFSLLFLTRIFEEELWPWEILLLHKCLGKGELICVLLWEMCLLSMICNMF